MSHPSLRLAYPGIFDLVGGTPLVELYRLGPDSAGVRLLLKLEGRNPGGSVKDRPALRILQDALEDGRLRPGVPLVDSSSGNTGIAYALYGKALGVAVRIYLPANANQERKQLLHAYGAEIVHTDPLEGSDGAIREVQRVVEREGDRVFYADQYGNPSNWRAHYDTTAVEILEQTGGAVTHFVAGLGTTGTMVGVGRRLKEHDPNIELTAVQPDSSFHGIEGLKHLETAIVPPIYDGTVVDRHVAVGTEDAQRMVFRLAREEGLFVGPSGGAAVLAALEVARGLHEGTIVVLIPDGGERYLTDAFLEELS